MRNPARTAVAVMAVSGLSIAMLVATKRYANMKITGIIGKNFIE
jgi:hypothetical protein